MKIIFDLRKVGLGNNGGSSTLIKSGNTLVDLGHDVTFIDSGRNQHTWTELKAKHIIPNKNEEIPSADFIIATGYKSVALTTEAPERFGKKAHWIRGWETWQMPEDKIVSSILKAPTIKMVNSICLQNKLKEYKTDSKIIRPGYDLDELYPLDIRGQEDFIIGGLYTKGKHERIKRTTWIFSVFTYMKQRGYKVKLWMIGNDENSNRIVSKYFFRPSKEEKNLFYNSIDLWLAPAMQEGLHMPPAEAMMTECPVVSTNAPMSGTQDYMVHGSTGFVSKNTIDSFTKCVETLYHDRKSRKQMGINARKKIESLGDRKSNMNKLIEYFMEIVK